MCTACYTAHGKDQPENATKNIQYKILIWKFDVISSGIAKFIVPSFIY